MKFETQTGTIYEIRDGKVRRYNPDVPKRADGEWVEIYRMSKHVQEGMSVYFSLEPLSDYGPDNPNKGFVTDTTVRVTSPVSKIWED